MAIRMPQKGNLPESRTFSIQNKINNLIGKTVAGYQLWFRAGEDRENGWVHWNGNSAPAQGHVSFELYPDVREYPAKSLHRTKLGNLGDGQPSMLYNAADPAVIGTQMSWLRRYGIDGVAVQRFYGTTSTVYTTERDHLYQVMKAAEACQKLFYVMYDFSGAGRDNERFFERVSLDLINSIERKGIAASPSYAHACGKPVICLWGLDSHETPRYPSATAVLKLIGWLKERGYFIIGGIPDNNWTEETDDFAQVYRSIDMASPWTPGRYDLNTAEEWLSIHLPRDLQFCRDNGILYQPVLFPGFAWSNWEYGRPNAYPREAGRFLWKQAGILRNAGVDTAYFAMFDEYDEGTALIKAAEDSFSIPTDQYFLTLAADGKWLSSDYYLRAAGAVVSLLKGETAPADDIPIPYSVGPVYWRNGFEKRRTSYKLHGCQEKQDALVNLDVCLFHPGLVRQDGILIEETDITETDKAFSGRYCFSFGGMVESEEGGSALYRIADARIGVPHGGLTLQYALWPGNEPGRGIFIDLLFDDGETLAQKQGVFDEKPVPGRWNLFARDVPGCLAGKSIVAVLAAVQAKSKGRFRALLDDILLIQKDVGENGGPD